MPSAGWMAHATMRSSSDVTAAAPARRPTARRFQANPRPSLARSNWAKCPTLLFDNLVRPCEQHGRQGQAERLDGLEIDHQLEFGRPPHWQVGGLGALENLPDIIAGLVKNARDIGAITHHAAVHDELAQVIDRGDAILRRQCQELSAIAGEQRARRDHERAGAALDKARESRLEVALAAGLEHDDLFAEHARGGADVALLLLGLRRAARIDVEVGN